MPTVFEVGKKYRHKFEPGIVRECLYVYKVAGGTWAMMSGHAGDYCPVCRQWGTEWFEYVDPVKGFKSVYLHRASNKFIIMDSASGSDVVYKFISTIELTYDIHNGLKVEIIPGIG